MDMKQPSSLLLSFKRSMRSGLLVHVFFAVALSTTLSACSKSETPQAAGTSTDTETATSPSKPQPLPQIQSQPQQADTIALSVTADTPAEQASDSITQNTADAAIATEHTANTSTETDPSATTGESLYVTSCKACHDAGLLNSPKLDDSTAWAPRLAQGKDMLYQHVIEGLNSMPARGGAVDASDDELKAAVDYMVAQLP